MLKNNTNSLVIESNNCTATSYNLTKVMYAVKFDYDKNSNSTRAVKHVFKYPAHK